jgi:hypothetical protein
MRWIAPSGNDNGNGPIENLLWELPGIAGQKGNLSTWRLMLDKPNCLRRLPAPH